MQKYLENWRRQDYYGQNAQVLEFDDCHRIILTQVTSDRYNLVLRYQNGVHHNAVIMKRVLRKQPTYEQAKLTAIHEVLNFLHESAVRFSYGATNLRVLTGVSQSE